jgi:hypothetical protein
LIYVATTT